MNYLLFELRLFKGWRTAVPLMFMGILMFFPALLTAWSGSNDGLSGVDLAQHICTKSMMASLPGLFFSLWIIQYVSHLNNTGYYRSLLIFGLSRNALFVYNQVQILLYLLGFLSINFLGASMAGFIFGAMPWQLISQLDFNSLLAQILFLFGIGNLASLISFKKPSHLIVLVFLFYWFLESWFAGYAGRQWGIEEFLFLPFSTFKLIIGGSVLTITQLIAIGIFGSATLILHHQTILKKTI